MEGFDVVCTGDEVTNGKPAPDIFALAAARFNAAGVWCLGFLGFSGRGMERGQWGV